MVFNNGPPPTDPTLQHPRCVFQILERHFARYTPEMVERDLRLPARAFPKVAETICENSGRERTTAFAYAVGWTQHTTGVQIIRAAGILQLLLGNIGRPGGGILALRGHATIQGSTDIPTLYNLLPGYLPQPPRRRTTARSQTTGRRRLPTGCWANVPNSWSACSKAWYGDAATTGERFRLRLAARRSTATTRTADVARR